MGQGTESAEDGIIDKVTDGAELNDGMRSSIGGRQPRPSCIEEPLMSRRKPLAALAAAVAALAVALPTASASAATTTPAFPTLPTFSIAGSLPCQILVSQIQFASQTGNTLWANVLSNVFVYSGCGGAAI